MKQIDILAIGVHPDDVELGAAGTLIKHIAKGFKVGMLDLTEGELGTRGSVEIRYAESAKAAEVIGVEFRENLQMGDGFFENNKENQLKLIQFIRSCKPKWIIGNAPRDRHPDHGRAHELIKTACFLSGLRMIETLDEGGKVQEAWRPEKVLSFIQDTYIEPDLYFDITEHFEQKKESIAAYQSQFFPDGSRDPQTYISNPMFLKTIEARDILFGRRINAQYAEGFLMHEAIGIDSLGALI